MSKKKFRLFLFAVISLTYCIAQEQGNVALTFQLGANHSSYWVSSDLAFNSRITYNSGLFADFYVSDQFSVRTGIMLDPKGAKNNIEEFNNLTYFTVPLVVNWHFGYNKNWHIHLGPAASFLVTAQIETPEGDLFSLERHLPKVDLGLAAGFGHRFPLNNNLDLTFDYQWLNGFSNLNQKETSPYYNPNEIYFITNIRSSLSFGLIINI